jgi:hypothetical protein
MCSAKNGDIAARSMATLFNVLILSLDFHVVVIVDDVIVVVVVSRMNIRSMNQS